MRGTLGPSGQGRGLTIVPCLAARVMKHGSSQLTRSTTRSTSGWALRASQTGLPVVDSSVPVAHSIAYAPVSARSSRRMFPVSQSPPITRAFWPGLSLAARRIVLAVSPQRARVRAGSGSRPSGRSSTLDRRCSPTAPSCPRRVRPAPPTLGFDPRERPRSAGRARARSAHIDP